jgi:hypothetical protein
MLFVVGNAIWLWYDADANGANLWLDAEIQFKIVENLFCAFFFIELLIRFAAVASPKTSCLRDGWFVLDLVVVVLTVIDTWLIPSSIVLLRGGEGDRNVGNLGVFRMLRLLRLARMVELLQAVPELYTLIRGLTLAFRAVFSTILLLCTLLFVFAILCRTQVKVNTDPAIEEQYFGSCMDSVWTLLLFGTFVDNIGILVGKIQDKDPLLLAFFLAFVFLSSFTLMNLLIGIICEVVSTKSKQLASQAEFLTVQNNLLDILDCYDKRGSATLDREEFRLLMSNPEVIHHITVFGSDVRLLNATTEAIFERETSYSSVGELAFEEFFYLLARLQTDQAANLNDLMGVRDYTSQRFDKLQESLECIVGKIEQTAAAAVCSGEEFGCELSV